MPTGDAVHLRRSADDDLEHALARLPLHAENSFQWRGGDVAGRRSVPGKLLSACGLSRPDFRNPVVDFLHAAGERAGLSHAADMHEVDFRLIEEEVIVQRGHFETGVECGAHRRVDLVLEHDSVAHHHDLSVVAGVNAAHEPRPMKGGIGQPSTWIFTSFLGLPILKTFSSAMNVPLSPDCCSILAVSINGVGSAVCGTDTKRGENHAGQHGFRVA